MTPSLEDHEILYNQRVNSCELHFLQDPQKTASWQLRSQFHARSPRFDHARSREAKRQPSDHEAPSPKNSWLALPRGVSSEAFHARRNASLHTTVFVRRVLAARVEDMAPDVASSGSVQRRGWGSAIRIGGRQVGLRMSRGAVPGGADPSGPSC